MLRFVHQRHLAALCVSCLIVFGLRPQQMINLKPFLPPETAAYLVDYTPYYPGQKELYRHEIFAPYNRGKRKIVVLGSSVADSIGCDSSWSTANPHRQPERNVHKTCSVTGHLNTLLERQGLKNWQAFNLACDSSRLATMLLTYARIAALKPDIVVFIDSFPYSETQNAGVTYLDANLYAYMDSVYTETAEVAPVWHAYNRFLTQQGAATDYKVPSITTDTDKQQKNDAVSRITLNDILVAAIGHLRNILMLDAQPLPVLLEPQRRIWMERGDRDQADPSPLPDYLQGFDVMNTQQAAHKGQFVLVFAPMFDERHNAPYLSSIREGRYGSYLRAHNINTLDLVSLPLKPVYETYDGFHQTTYGNAKIADAIFTYLKTQHMLPEASNVPN